MASHKDNELHIPPGGHWLFPHSAWILDLESPESNHTHIHICNKLTTTDAVSIWKCLLQLISHRICEIYSTRSKGLLQRRNSSICSRTESLKYGFPGMNDEVLSWWHHWHSFYKLVWKAIHPNSTNCKQNITREQCTHWHITSWNHIPVFSIFFRFTKL